MHTFELTSPKVSISISFPMQKKGFSLFLQWIVYFSSLVRPGKLFRNYLTNQRFSGPLFKFLIVYKKTCTTFRENFENNVGACFLKNILAKSFTLRQNSRYLFCKHQLSKPLQNQLVKSFTTNSYVTSLVFKMTYVHLFLTNSEVKNIKNKLQS